MMRHSEYQYLDLLNRVMISGDLVTADQERTGTGGKKLIGEQMKFDLRDGFPLLTTKKMNFRNIILELLRMLSGETKVSALARQGVRIWNDDAYRVYSVVTKEEGKTPLPKNEYKRLIVEDQEFGDRYSDLGPIYGKQRRNLNTYRPIDVSDKDGTMSKLYEKGEGIDQVSEVIKGLKNNPYDRAHIISARNVAELDKMGLRPCHNLSQYSVAEKDGNRYLDCSLYQRSGDLFLGVPYNTTSYALLTSMIAQCIGAIPRYLIHTLGDGHIYANHFDQVQDILAREPREMPILKLNKEIQNIFDFREEDVELLNYKPHSAIKAPLSVGLQEE